MHNDMEIITCRVLMYVFKGHRYMYNGSSLKGHSLERTPL